MRCPKCGAEWTGFSGVPYPGVRVRCSSCGGVFYPGGDPLGLGATDRLIFPGGVGASATDKDREAARAALTADIPLPPASEEQEAEPVEPPADWYADPAGRHEYRYWDGTSWTHHVADSGVQGIDPL
jgi:hypothetical protein